MTEYFEQQGEVTVRRRPLSAAAAGILSGEQGNEGIFHGGPLISLQSWQFLTQDWQPPRFRYAQRIAALLAGDASGFNSFGTVIGVSFKEGWAVLQVQPPSPRNIAHPNQLAGALARGDDGITNIFIAPWVQAPRASSFPNEQNDPRAAIPTYNAGPQPGSTSSMPNITTPTTLKASPGVLLAVTVVVAGSTGGTANDCTAIGQASQANEFYPIPNAAGIYVLDWPCQKGITLVPGTGQVLAAKWT